MKSITSLSTLLEGNVGVTTSRFFSVFLGFLPRQIRLQCGALRPQPISPGPIRTPFQGAAQSSPELIKQFLDDVPMQRFGEPEEIGELVLFVCSDACQFMTADTVYVNGGGGWR